MRGSWQVSKCRVPLPTECVAIVRQRRRQLRRKAHRMNTLMKRAFVGLFGIVRYQKP